MKDIVYATFRAQPLSCVNIAILVMTIGVLLLSRALTSSKSNVRLLPVPDGAHVIWGHEKDVFMNQPGTAYRRWMRQLGLAFRIKAAFGAPNILILCDPVGITYLLQKKVYDYHHSALVRPRVARLMGKGIGWLEGEQEHKKLRRLTMPALTADNVKTLAPEITASVMKVVNDLAKSVQEQGNKAEVNLIRWTGKATLNIIGRVTFLYDFDGGNSEEAQNILNARRQGVSPIAKYAGFLTLMLLRRFPFLNNIPIAAIQGQALMKQAIHNGVARQLLSRSKENIDDTKISDAKDLLTILLSAAEEEKMSIEELYDQISTFIISGFETTTTTISFAIWELARNPEKQRRLREELATISGQPTIKDMQEKLPYLDAIMKESLRLYPVLPYMERISTKPDVIPLRDPIKMSDGSMSSEIVLEAGQTVVIPIIAVHRQDDVWKDADVFRPERWLEDMPAADRLCAGWGNMLAFSDGLRSCPGVRLAIFNFKIILASVATRFYFEDMNMGLSLKIASSLQPFVHRSKDDPGSNELPVILHLLEDK